MQQVVTSSIIVVATGVIREVFTQRRPRELLSKQINLVQEEDLTDKCELRQMMASSERNEHTIEVLTNHRELHIESKRVRASCIRF